MIQYIKKNLNSVLLFISVTIIFIISSIINYKCIKANDLWPYEVKSRFFIITFTLVFLFYVLYTVIGKNVKFYITLLKLLPSIIIIYAFLLSDDKLIDIFPILLPIVLVVQIFDYTSGIFLQGYTVILYYFTCKMTEEVLLFYFAFGFIIIYLCKTSKHKTKGLTFAISTVSYISFSIIYQYMLFEKIDYLQVLKGFVSLIITLIPFFAKDLLIYYNQKIINAKLKQMCNDENELFMSLLDVNSKAYYHSLAVADLATKVAEKMGANINLVNASARFHEIGRIKGDNYVSSGLIILKKYKAPDAVIRIVREHNSKNNIPQSVESLIVMLSDSIETTINNIINEKGITSINKAKIAQSVIDIRLNSGMLDKSINNLQVYKKIRNAFIDNYK